LLRPERGLSFIDFVSMYFLRNVEIDLRDTFMLSSAIRVMAICLMRKLFWKRKLSMRFLANVDKRPIVDDIGVVVVVVGGGGKQWLLSSVTTTVVELSCKIF
jgi:hypothetical protein